MLIVTIVLTILAVLIAIFMEYDHEILAFFSGCGAMLFGILDLVLIIWILTIYSEGFAIKDKIKMYQEENKVIEEQITTIVNNFQGYEKEIISNVADMEVYFIKIPELKSSELATKQMNVHIENNNKIKALKEEQINMKLGKWLLYFGK